MAGFLDDLAKEDRAPAKAAARGSFLDELAATEDPDTFWHDLAPSKPVTAAQLEGERALVRRATPQMQSDIDVAMAPATPEQEIAANREQGLPDDFPRHNSQETTGEWWKAELGGLLRPETWGRTAKLSARNAYEGLTAPPLMAMDAGVGLRNLATGENYEMPSEMHRQALDEFLPSAQGGLESVASFGQQAAAGGGLPTPKVGRAVPENFVSPQAAPSAAPSAAPKTAAAPSVQDQINAAAGAQSMGAAGASVDLNTLSPKLRANVEQAVGAMGGKLSPEQLAAVVRYKRAESLPAPVYMTQGQALGDSHLASIERNARGKHEAYTKGFDAQDKALTKNLEMMRDEAGPEVFTTNTTQHGDTLIGRYQAIDDAANAEISQNYQALRDAAGGEFPVDTQALLTNTKAALKKDLATNSAPPDVMALLEEGATNGKMSFEDFESLRTALSRIQRSSSDGQARHAAGVIRDQVEQMPLLPEAASLKQIADTARNSARARFQALDADPAYKAAVEGKVSPDAFVQKFLTGKSASRDSVTKLVAAMEGDEAATQTVRVATLDHLRDAARIDRDYKGVFANAGYNKAIRALEEQSKLDLLLGQKTAETSRELGQVAFDLKHQSEGAFVNNSNSTTALLAEKATDALEGILNYKTGGIPIASEIRKKFAEGRIAKEAEKTFEPGAGLQKLSDLSKLEKKK